MKAIGIKEFLSKSFDVYEFTGEWQDSFGEPEKNFVMVLYGESGNGKTEFAVKLTKYLATFRKVLYCSYEQGISKSLQDAIRRNDMMEVDGKVLFISNEPFHELILRLKRKQSAEIVVLDSLDYMRLTTEQFKTLRKTFPRKAFIIVCWSRNDKPKLQSGKDIEYMADIKVLVKAFKAAPRCRFGGNKPFVIWDKKPQAGHQLKLIEHGND